MQASSLRLVLFLVFFQEAFVQGQESTASSTSTVATEELAKSFQLLWYHWLAIIIVASLIVLVLAPTAVCLVHFLRKTYAVRLAEQGRAIPPGYVLEKDLPKRVKDEVDGLQMDALFRHMEGDYKEIDRNDITISHSLGIGEFGPILDAEVKIDVNDYRRAMIKVFQQGTSQDLVRFRDEVESLKRLDHPQMAKLFGVVSKSPYYMITELTINGDLKSFLLSSADREDHEGNPAVPVPKLVAMATDVASGLSYLECMDYVHTDIAARNCLVTEDLCVKVADVKVGRYLSRSEYAVQADGSLMPLRWMAPETILNNKFTLESSVWSFGVLLWEVMSRGGFPYSRLTDEEVVQAVCHNKEQLPRPSKECPDRVCKVMLECWLYDPYTRPHMALAHKLMESSILTNKYDKSHVRLYS